LNGEASMQQAARRLPLERGADAIDHAEPGEDDVPKG
jgi:hypothetical protein